MKRPLRTGVPLRVTSVTSITPRDVLTSERLHALYGVDVHVVDAPLPYGGSRRVALPAGGQRQ